MNQITGTERDPIGHRSPTAGAPTPLLVTVKQACHMLGLGRTSIHHLVCSGELKPVRIGSAVRFSVEHLKDFINAHATDR
jgi:excisionase family DNA binding protein